MWACVKSGILRQARPGQPPAEQRWRAGTGTRQFSGMPSANVGEPWRVLVVDRMTHDDDLSFPPSEPSDAELVGLARAHDERAFELLVRRHYRAAFAVALAYARTRLDAEDVCHDAFIKAAERLDDCRSPDRFLPWLCAIVRNHARNLSARSFLRRAVQLLPTMATSSDDPERSAELNDLRSRLEAALSQLPPIQRETVLLHDLHGCSHETIAGIVGTSEGMSRQHLFKARRRLRKLLGSAATVEYMND